MPYHVFAHELYHIGKQIRGIRQVRPSDSFESERCSITFQGEYLWGSNVNNWKNASSSCTRNEVFVP